MIISRFIRQIKGQHWLAFVIDFVIVVLGVFIGLQVNNWNGARHDRARETYVLSQLTVEIQTIQAGARSNIDAYTRKVLAANRIMALLASDKDAPEDNPAFLVDLTAVDYRQSPVERSTTFIELLSSGEIQLIRHNKLRTSLVHFDQYMQTYLRQDAILTSYWVPYDYVLNRRISPADNLDANGGVHLATGAYDLDGMRRDPKFLVALQQTRRVDLVSIQANQRIVKLSEDIIGQLKHAKP